jgi:hypothetical protein
MRDIPGWVVGALGTGAIVAAFYAGGSAAKTPDAVMAPVAAATAADNASVDLACEPGQRAVMRTVAGQAPSLACLSEPAVLARTAGSMAHPVAYTPGSFASTPAMQPVPVNEPMEVYQPRVVRTSYPARSAPAREPVYRSVRRPTRTWQKSAVIIGGSTAVGAAIGGLTKGTKGAVVGGLLGGGAATVWDQVTRRRNDGNR